MKVSRTAYYRYARGNSYNSDKKYLRAKHEIRKEFLVNKKRYGSRRIKVAILENGIEISRKTVVILVRNWVANKRRESSGSSVKITRLYIA